MKIDERFLKFPAYLPNDLEGLIFLYPEKFPPIVTYFEEVAPKIAGDPQAFRDYGNWASDELWKAYRKIKADYDAGNQQDLAFLISIDQRFSKIYCYRFWIVNYLFPDGPFHDYLVDNLKNLIRKFIDVTDEVEDFEQRIVAIQRDLLQSEYADLYLRQALDGVKVVELLQQDQQIAPKLEAAEKLIDQHNQANTEQVNNIWKEVYELIKNQASGELKTVMEVPLEQVEMRSSMLPLYNMLTHAVEFRNENHKLAQRYAGMGNKIDQYKNQAQAALTDEEYELFVLCYEQARNFSMYKDIMGAIDVELLPVWFGMYKQMTDILISQGSNIKPRPAGPSGVNHHIVWYLPPELKAKVMTPDFTPFSLETI